MNLFDNFKDCNETLKQHKKDLDLWTIANAHVTMGKRRDCLDIKTLKWHMFKKNVKYTNILLFM